MAALPISYNHRSRRPIAQSGASLLTVMLILTIVSLIGVAGVQISLMGERSARNDRDAQVAAQAAEAVLMDAELELFANSDVTTAQRRAIFATPLNLENFSTDCGNSGPVIGLCALAAAGQPAWLRVNFEDNSGTARSARFGEYTGRNFRFGNIGVQPVREPRYVVEPIEDRGANPDASTRGTRPPTYAYRVTGMGFGPRLDNQVVMQIVYRN
jgi:type IV pilus assembly protein PilX